MKKLCQSCEHLIALGKTQIDGEMQPYKFCSFKNISLQNIEPATTCFNYEVSEKATPEEKYKAISLI
jgi:hypothetical protein